MLLVLELNGAAYQTSLARAIKFDSGSDDDVRYVAAEKHRNSRLFVVDAGLDAATIRVKYPARQQYAIVRGQIRLTRSSTAGTGNFVGMVSALNIQSLHVPNGLRPTFEGATRESEASEGKKSARYEVNVSFGQRLELWIIAAKQTL